LPSLLLIFLKCLQKLIIDLTLNGVATHSLRSPAQKDSNAHAAVRKGNRKNDKDFSILSRCYAETKTSRSCYGTFETGSV